MTIESWSIKQVNKLAKYEFPGGYSAWDTREDCTFNAKVAHRCVNFGPTFIKHVKGSKGGQAFYPEEWQAALFANIFGWIRPDGLRRYRNVYLEVPRGNGKSFLCVVIVGILLYLDDEPGADIFSAAGTRDQAREVFGPFKHNVLTNPSLAKISNPYQNSITRIDKRSGLPLGVYKAIAADADFQHGGNPHGIIFDELHVQPNRDLWDVLQTGKIKRDQPLTVAITTAGFDKNSICWEQRQWAERVRDGLVPDKEFLPAVYAAEKDDDWTSPKVWRKANPNLGVSIKEDDIAKECLRAKEVPGYENTFKRLHLNVWTDSESLWLPMDKWDQQAVLFSEDDLRGEDCYAGLDLSSTTDITALTLVFTDSTPYRILSYFWAPEENARLRERRDRVPYASWANQGFIELTPGNSVDYDFVRMRINELGEKFNIKEIAIDRWNSTQLQTQLMGDSFEVVPFGQGYASMTAPTKELERLVLDKHIVHTGNPILRWMASNTVVEQDAAGNLKPSKKKSTEKIDGIVALVMALGRVIAMTEAPNYIEVW